MAKAIKTRNEKTSRVVLGFVIALFIIATVLLVIGGIVSVPVPDMLAYTVGASFCSLMTALMMGEFKAIGQENKLVDAQIAA